MSDIIDFITKDWKKYLGKSPEYKLFEEEQDKIAEQELFEAEQDGIAEEERSKEDNGEMEYGEDKK
jgi:hypothetical protein